MNMEALKNSKSVSSTGFGSTSFLVGPGIQPSLIGTLTLNTNHQVAFPLSSIFPSTARQISVTVFIYSGLSSVKAPFSVWLWTECDGKVHDTKYKRGLRYPQDAFSFDSETFDFAYCPSHPKLYLKTNIMDQNMGVELYAVGYANI
jgi:hypothetical protein